MGESVPNLDQRRPPRQVLQERVSAAILAAAAEVLAREGAGASMSDVAATAGMARATVYRYFPTRQALLDHLADVAVTDAGARLREARLESVPAEDAVVRAVRAFLDVGDYFTVLARERVRVDPARRDELIMEPLARMFARGQETRAFRRDIPAAWLASALVDVVESVVSTRPSTGRDDTVELISALFLDGARGATKDRRGGPSSSR